MVNADGVCARCEGAAEQEDGNVVDVLVTAPDLISNISEAVVCGAEKKRWLNMNMRHVIFRVVLNCNSVVMT